MRLLDRYVLKELFMPMVFGISAFTSIFLGTDLVRLTRLAIDMGAPFDAVVRLLIVRLPQIVVWTSPMTVLLATLLSLSRLSADSEVIAMKACGVSVCRIIAPVLLLGLIIALMTFFISDRVVPVANSTYERILTVDVRGRKLPAVSKNVVLNRYHSGVLSWFLYAAEFDGKEKVFRKVTMVDFEGGRPVRTTYVHRVTWKGDAWYMGTGSVYIYGKDGRSTVIDFSDGTQKAPIDMTPGDVMMSKRSPDEMTAAELRNYIKILREQGQDVSRYLVDYYAKYSLPAASFFFALIGAPLGLCSKRPGASTGFGFSVGIIFTYYIIMTLGSALGESGFLTPLTGAWLQNVIVGSIGILLLIRINRK